MSTGLLPIIGLFADRAGVLGTTAGLPYPTIRQNLYWPPCSTYYTLVRGRQRPNQSGPQLLTGTNRPTPAVAYKDVYILDFTCGWAVHIFSKTDVAKIATCINQLVSIMNSTSTSFVHPVRNQGAADPTAPTIIPSPSSVSSGQSALSGSLPSGMRMLYRFLF